MLVMYPYPGLRPFHSSESEIFFGREEQTDDLLRKLSQTRFLGVIGPSGCGKSSLVLAGMIPALEAGFVVQAGSVWKIATMRPGSHPFAALTEALLENDVLGSEWKKNTSTIDQAAQKLGATLRRGPRGLIEVLEETPLPQETNLLLIVDQFEELFRLRSKKNTDEQDAFVALLLETVAQTDLQVYVVITMRSDYLGDCAIFHGLPEALNRSQYLTPRLNRTQREEAITGPARVFGGDVEPALVNRLLNETGSDPNQLPVLQHLLMRMWSTTKPSKKPDPEDPFSFGIPEDHLGHVLTLSDYEQVGGLAEALSRHADQAYESLSGPQKEIAEVLFKTICERGSAQRDGRHPTPVATIAERAGVLPEDIIGIVEKFRNPSYGFLVPPLPHQLHQDSIIDISHESLIRLWKRLSAWVDEEAKAAETYRWLEQSARRWKQGEAALWKTPNLETALAWKEREHPTAEWAERYGGNFQLAMEFLEASLAGKQAEEAEKEALRQQKLRKAQRSLKLSIAAIAAGIIAIMAYAYLYVIPYETYSRNFTKQWGVIYPVGPLDHSAIPHRSWTIKLTRYGMWNPVVKADVVDSDENPTPYHAIGTYLDDWDKVEKEEKPVRYEFVYDRNGKVVYEVALDRFNRRSWTFVHSPSGQQSKASKKDFFENLADNILSHLNIVHVTHDTTTIKGFFVDAEGFPKPMGHSRAEIVKIELDKNGFETKRSYFDRSGNPQPGPDNAYGVQMSYDDKGRLIRLISLNEKGQPANDDAWNAELFNKYDNKRNLIEQTAFDAQGEPTLVRTGWYKVIAEYDDWGNPIEIRYLGLSGEPVIETKDFNAHKITFEYDDHGNKKSMKLFGTAEEPINPEISFANFSPIFVHEKRYAYNSDNKLISESYFDTSKKKISSKEGLHKWKYEYDHNGYLCAESALDIKGILILNQQGYGRTEWVNDELGRHLEERYFAANRKPVVSAEGYHCVKRAYDRAGNITEERWIGADGKTPVSSSAYGVPCVKRKFNIFGHQLAEWLCDASGNPINGPQQYSQSRSWFDESGNLIGTRWLDKDGKDCNGPNGVHLVRMRYGSESASESLTDKMKKITESRYDIHHQPVVGNDGIHKIFIENNNKRQQTKYQCFGLNRKPVEDKNGDHLVESQYDEKGRQISYRSVRADGSPNFDRELGVAGWKMVFNKNNQWTEQAFYDADKKPVFGTYGCVKGVMKYDSDGGTAIYSYGKDNKLNFNALYGYAIRYIGPNKTVYYGVDKKLITGPYGFAEKRITKDKNGNALSESFFGPDGKPVIGPSGYHRVAIAKDGKTFFYFDTSNRQITDSKNYPLRPVMFIEEILDIKQPAYSIGLHAGDVVWNYGTWSYTAALLSEMKKGTANKKITDAVFQSFLAERDRCLGEQVSMTVLRNGRPVTIKVAPLPNKTLGFKRSFRLIPLEQFREWQNITSKQASCGVIFMNLLTYT
ncbi:MAG: hypothetical protein WBP54_04940 [Pelodictyon phaeoclathratiforme]